MRPPPQPHTRSPMRCSGYKDRQAIAAIANVCRGWETVGVSGGWVASIFAGVLAFVLWVCSLLLLRMTSLTGAGFLLASLAVTFGLTVLGWSFLVLWERVKLRRDS